MVFPALGLRAVVFVVIAGCSGSPPPPPKKGKPSVVDPASCVEPGFDGALSRLEDVERLVDARLADLAGCTRGVSRDELLTLMLRFEDDGTLVRSAVARNTMAECDVGECLRAGLSTIAPAARGGGKATHWVHISLSSQEPPRRVEWSSVARDRQWGRCGDEQASLDTPQSDQVMALRAALAEHPEELRECYVSALGRDATISGRMVLHVVLDEDGKLTMLKVVRNTLPDCTLVECSRDAFSRLEFPPPVYPNAPIFYPIRYMPTQ